MKLSKKGIPYRAAKKLGIAGFMILFSGGSVNTFNLVVAFIGSILLLTVFSLLLAYEYLYWKRFDFFIHEEAIKITKGVLRRQEREIPFRRIQNVDVKKNIVHRILGIARIELETAGGGETEASLSYIDVEEVKRIREMIKHGETVKNEKEERMDESLYKITDRNLVLLSAAELDARLFLLFFAGLGIFSTSLGTFLEQLNLLASAVLGVLLVGSLIVIFVSNFARNFEKYYGFRLWRSGEKLKYESGLLNRREGTIPLEKVQGLGLEENLLKRFIGYATLKIETAGYSGQKAMKQGAEAAIPLARRQEVVEYAERLGDLRFKEMQPIAEKSRRRYFARYMILVTAGSGVIFAITGALIHALIFSTAGLLISGLGAHLKWIHRGYAEGDDNIFTRKGFWNRRTDIYPYYRIQNLIETRTIFQRRWDLASLTIDTAGSTTVLDNPKVMDLETERMKDLEESVYRRFQESLN